MGQKISAIMKEDMKLMSIKYKQQSKKKRMKERM